MGRKDRYSCSLTALMVLLGLVVQAQQNLVPNPSFEEYSWCPDAPGQIWLAVPWIKIGGDGGINYYNECGEECCGVPLNRVGHQLARTGVAYGDLSLVHNNHLLSFHVESNFLGTSLTDTLELGHRYHVEFYLSLYDSARFACMNVGAYFSHGQPTTDLGTLLSLEPQVRYNGDFLTDKEGWMRIAGDFIADGGENYMTIGNFDGYFNSDTMNLHEGGVVDGTGAYNIGYWEVAFYYLDDVSIVEDTSYHVGVDEMRQSAFGINLYPNPNTGEFTVFAQLEEKDHARITVWNVSGQVVHAAPLSNGTNTMRLDVADGMLLYTVTVNGEMRWAGKVTITPSE